MQDPEHQRQAREAIWRMVLGPHHKRNVALMCLVATAFVVTCLMGSFGFYLGSSVVHQQPIIVEKVPTYTPTSDPEEMRGRIRNVHDHLVKDACNDLLQSVIPAPVIPVSTNRHDQLFQARIIGRSGKLLLCRIPGRACAGLHNRISADHHQRLRRRTGKSGMGRDQHERTGTEGLPTDPEDAE